jgi:hypothetical protein
MATVTSRRGRTLEQGIQLTAGAGWLVVWAFSPAARR